MAVLSSSSAAGSFVPEWAKEVVWYQIFPERFCNGDASNDPDKQSLRGTFQEYPEKPWALHPWGSDWYARQAWEKDNGLSLQDNILRRRYGGDLQGVIDKLDYLQDLGVDALYLNPVFDAPSLHKYDGRGYHHIDPHFGPDPEGDRALMAKENPSDPRTWVWTAADKLALKLIKEVHARGMRVIFDGVFNHLGMDSYFFRDVKERQEASAYKDWFNIKSWRNAEKGTEFDYVAWFGSMSLPELREDAQGIVAGPRQYIFACTERWMAPNGKVADGIDGWRLDVAFCVKHPFWKAWRKHVKGINGEAYLTAEIIEPAEKLVPYLQGDEFDAVMNYNFAFLCDDYFVSRKPRLTASEFGKKLERLRKAFPAGVSEVQQNLLDSHDTARIGSLIVNRNKYRFGEWQESFDRSKALENPEIDPRGPNAEEKRLWRLLVLFQMTYVGAPMIYYGDEVGMWGANDPCCRKPMVWEELDYEEESVLPSGERRKKACPVKVDKELFAWYQKTIALRKKYAALRTGSFRVIVADDVKDVFGFVREKDGEFLVIMFNNSAKKQSVIVKVPSAKKYENVLNQGAFFSAPMGELILEISAKEGIVLKKIEG